MAGRILVKRFEQPDEQREFEKGRFQLLTVGGAAVGRASYEPGWKWSAHVGPTAGTPSCQVEHVGLVLGGRAAVRMDDGEERVLQPGDLFHVPPGHDSWVVGDEPYVSVHLEGAESYATREGAVPADAPRVSVFFYGSFINPEVLAGVGLRPARVQMARLDGFDIWIAPLANLVRAEGAGVYGILTTATHAELDELYAYARHGLGGSYLPEAVVVQTEDGVSHPALCYIAPSLQPGPPDAAYVDRILGPARELGFPEAYLERLQSFRPR